MLFPGDPGFKYLDENEKVLIEGIEAKAEFAEVLPEAEKQVFLEQFRKPDPHRKNVTMRLSESVILGLKARAEADGIPYQTLASMILQKYIRGALLERDAVQEVVKALKV